MNSNERPYHKNRILNFIIEGLVGSNWDMQPLDEKTAQYIREKEGERRPPNPRAPRAPKKPGL